MTRISQISGANNFINGQVNTYTDLPVAANHSGQVWMVLYGSGVYILNYKDAGPYYSDGSDWSRLGKLYLYFDTDNFRLNDGTDNTKLIDFDLSGITTGNTRTIKISNYDQDLANPTFLTLKVGDVSGGDYSEIESDGTYKAVGDATTYRDEYVGGAWVEASAQAAPGLESYTIGGVATRKYAFNGVNTEERLSNSFEIPHDYKINSPIEVHIHWRPSTNDTGNVKWFFDWEYSKANLASSVTVAPEAQDTLSCVCAVTANTQYYHYITTIGILPTNGYNIGDLIGFTLRRSPADDQDTYEEDAILEKIALHVECDTLGSRQRYTK